MGASTKVMGGVAAHHSICSLSSAASAAEPVAQARSRQVSSSISGGKRAGAKCCSDGGRRIKCGGDLSCSLSRLSSVSAESEVKSEFMRRVVVIFETASEEFERLEPLVAYLSSHGVKLLSVSGLTSITHGFFILYPYLGSHGMKLLSLSGLASLTQFEGAARKPYCKALRRQSSLFPGFAPKQDQSSTKAQRKVGIAVAAAKRRPKQNLKQSAEKLAASLGLTKADQENGVLDLLDFGGFNGNWLSRDDELDDLDDSPFLDAVVKVYCTRSEPNFSLPWQKMRQYSVTGSGFMISKRRLLTNAHCVEHHTQVKLKRRGNDTKFVANVLAVGRECDIALLSVEDDEFWEGVEPLEFGSLPRLQDPVTVVGYPIGGETISVTSGVVSRVEITSYAHGATELLAVQIDAAINPGNSGGPAFDEEGQCVGIAFQSIDASDAENIGYVIPTPVIMHFLYDYERNGKNTGFPSSGLLWQRLENSALRAALKMMPTQRGVLIRRVEATSPAAQVLKKGDVLMKFDGVSVANEGTVPFQAGERIAFTFLASQKYSGDIVEVEVLRDGEVMTLQTAIRSPVRLVPVHINGKLPSYLIVAGLVFTVVSQPFLESQFGMDYEANIPVKILEKATYGMAETEDEQLVVVSQVLASDVNIGYEDIEATQVLTFNGVKIRNLKQLVQLADSCTDRYIQIELDNQMLVVLDTQQARAGIPQILRDHCIPADRSEDLL